MLSTTGSFVSEENKFSQIFTALAKAQSEMEVASYDKTNPHFKNKYASLESIIAATRPALTKNGLCVIQKMGVMGANMVLTTILAHSSGEHIESVMLILPNGSEIQKLGSYLTYCKRYSYVALVGCTSGDEDDDGEEDRKSAEIKSTKPEKKTQPEEPLTAAQVNWAKERFKEYGITFDDIQQEWDCCDLENMLQNNLKDFMNNVRAKWGRKHENSTAISA